MSVKLYFDGFGEQKAAKAIMNWIVDGGGEDILSQVLEENNITVNNMEFDMDKKHIKFIIDENKK